LIMATLHQELEANRTRLPGSTQTAQWRAAELASFAHEGFPTPRQENWRYTDLKAIAERRFDFVPDKPDAAAIGNVRALLSERGAVIGPRRLVFVDGHAQPELSAAPPHDGLELASLTDRWDKFERGQLRRLGGAGHPLARLNTVFTQHGAWIDMAAGVSLDEPLHLVFACSGTAGLALQPRVVIELGCGARLTVVQHFLDAGEPENWLNPVTQIHQGAHSALAFYRLQEHSDRQAHTSLAYAELGARAALQIGYVDLGGRLTRNDIDVRLLEPGASADLFGVFLASEQHVDNHTRVDHVAPETRSDEAFRGIIGRAGRGVFNGKIVVHRDAQRVAAQQRNDNLLLSEQAEIDTKPELQIYADDVKCSHGTTVGELDPEQLFYLRTRSIDESSARAMLTLAFAESVLDRVRVPALREQIVERIAARLRAWERPR
jgi:Fe-S cluster assembly protein SufD